MFVHSSRKRKPRGGEEMKPAAKSKGPRIIEADEMTFLPMALGVASHLKRRLGNQASEILVLPAEAVYAENDKTHICFTADDYRAKICVCQPKRNQYQTMIISTCRKLSGDHLLDKVLRALGKPTPTERPNFCPTCATSLRPSLKCAIKPDGIPNNLMPKRIPEQRRLIMQAPATPGVDVGTIPAKLLGKNKLTPDERLAYQALREILKEQGVSDGWKAVTMKRPQSELAIWAKKNKQALSPLQRGYHGLVVRGLVVIKAKGRSSTVLIYNVNVRVDSLATSADLGRQPTTAAQAKPDDLTSLLAALPQHQGAIKHLADLLLTALGAQSFTAQRQGKQITVSITS